MLERIRDAMNSHDAERFASLFADDYESIQPAHPARGFRGRAQVLSNWSSVFEGVPDFASELLSSVVDGETEWGECEWRGHYINGSPFGVRGVMIVVTREGLVTQARLYLEPVDADGGDIDAAVQEMYRPPSEGTA